MGVPVGPDDGSAGMAAELRQQKVLLAVLVVVGLGLIAVGLSIAWAFFTGGDAIVFGDVDSSVVAGIVAVFATFSLTSLVLGIIAGAWMVLRAEPAPKAPPS